MRVLLLAGALAAVPTAGLAQTREREPRRPVQGQLDEAAQLIRAQSARLDAQEREIAALRARIDAQSAQASTSQAAPPAVAAIPRTVPLERVGQAPEDVDRPIELAVLDSTGSVVTRRGQLLFEGQIDYTRADRNRAVFRGIELIESVLVGVFDINESRQDIITASASLRYGLTDRLEVGVRVPGIYRSDTSILAPIPGSTPDDNAATIDNSVKGRGIGDVELTARYQIIDGGSASPYVIANLQGVIPTGKDAFSIARDELGRASSAATGGGFYAVAPSLTAILPSDPVVLFGTLGYTFNFARDVDTRIPPILIDYVDPGDSISASAGIGIAFNQRTTLNLGYAHSWAFGTRTRTRLIEPSPSWPGTRETVSRDLQIGRLLLGVTYRVSDRTSINWSVEVGSTEDAADIRTSLRIPVVLMTGK